MDQIEREIKKIASDLELDYGDARFVDSADAKKYIDPSGDALGGFIYEGSDLYYVMNGMDIYGSYYHVDKARERIEEVFKKHKVFFENYNGVSGLLWEL